MKDIKYLLNKIDVEQEAIKKITIFIKTKRGLQFVKKLHTSTLRDLCKRYETPKVVCLYKNNTKNINLIEHVIKKEGIVIPTKNRAKIVHIKMAKYPIYLTKKETKDIDAHRPRKTLGFAARMHAYEEAKIAKFIKLHPAPTERELKQDLFPEELKAGYNIILNAKREKIRKFVTSTYYKLPIYGRFKVAEGKFVNKKIAEIKDIDGGGHHINGISKEHNLIKKAQKIVDDYYKLDNNIVCIIIKGHTKQGRMLIPHKNIAAQLLVYHYSRVALQFYLFIVFFSCLQFCFSFEGRFESSVYTNQRILVSIW